MSDEIKEKLEKVASYIKVPMELAYIEAHITPVECKQLLDYISLLEENNESMQFEMCLTWKKLDEKEARIDKAIEFIEEHNIIGVNKEYLPNDIEKCYSQELMDILKGSDNK